VTPFQWAECAAQVTIKGQYAEACGYYRLAIKAQREQADGDPEYWVSIWSGCIMALEDVIQAPTPIHNPEAPRTYQHN